MCLCVVYQTYSYACYLIYNMEKAREKSYFRFDLYVIGANIIYFGIHSELDNKRKYAREQKYSIF